MYLYPYKAEWQSEFENEKELIVSNYEGNIDVFHIGSIAVKGLYAKDCIDLLGIVNDISDISDLTGNLIELGYIYKGEYDIHGREYFSKKQRKAHLHIFQSGDVNIEKHLSFVKVMQGNIELITELNLIKQGLHTKHLSDKDSYQNEKAFYYNRINNIL